MKAKNLVIVFLITFMASCGAEVVAIFIPLLSAVRWDSDRNSQFFFFTVANEGKNESDFSGNEVDDGGSVRSFEGHYKNYDVNFTFTSGPEETVKYTGKFIKDANPQRMEVTGTNGVKLKITRSQ
ncbi:hypothetical protein GS399_01520 [Pedobacter sp. HMF7647]|uniref:Lipoprotein n=1 Tax=Hufsiella arboris TaxID=2695275 RepID=A0A7K1Y4X9_9SPHI|nr:hypothetical protein [Hufsiella arboris]MXV49635.1 hypothetical protein [Hufsiella arboris]